MENVKSLSEKLLMTSAKASNRASGLINKEYAVHYSSRHSAWGKRYNSNVEPLTIHPRPVQ